ncbi:tRNA (adenosine(37)-N6)-dimethylallyltransferase MiaA [Candidatus Gracilibacteria bacterium]|nr:MAG: tRNA (adenosine(37)-N6)-dimethylallyltransferase MiaA [Candidatus Gracilibacteria bacterium]PIE85009.1 MAG: tRNA (adenosine(37)-N6)-dimethylallyltransferase MiaA [Candidatus Gracilibacteria bacterium]
MKEIKKFLEKKSNKEKIIVIYGPTGSGKTSMSIDIAKFLDTEIIGTDSRQIFKFMDIGTGKILEHEKKGIIHHMIDIINPDRTYSVGEFKTEAEKIIKEIHKNNKIPILCGGTGLYIDSLIYDFDIPKVPADWNLRKKLEEEARLYGEEYVYNKLFELDPNYAKLVHPNNLRYVIRGIEVKILTGKSKLEFKKEKSLKYETLFITPYKGDREELYRNINIRVKSMFDNGLINEVRDLLNKGYNEDDFGMKTIGYKESILYIKGLISLDETIALVMKENRNYAKRQLTWFSKYPKNKNL